LSFEVSECKPLPGASDIATRPEEEPVPGQQRRGAELHLAQRSDVAPLCPSAPPTPPPATRPGSRRTGAYTRPVFSST